MGKLSHWAVVFCALALAFAVLGFGNVAGAAAPLAKLLFWAAAGAAALALAGSALKRLT